MGKFYVETLQCMDYRGDNLKKIGLMITYNEEHFIKYSLPNLIRCVDQVLILDNSTDNTKEYCKQFENVIVFDEVFDDSKSRRQFLLDQGRKLNGTHFIVIDADEILSEELIKYLNSNWHDSLYCKWYHVYGDLYHAKNNYINEIQGIAFEDDGTDYHGNVLVHEDKIPNGRCDNYTKVPQSLLHFGTCNDKFTKLKRNIYKCYELLEGKHVAEINSTYINDLNVNLKIEGVTYPNDINVDILNTEILDDKYFDRLCEIVKAHYQNLYSLDIWSEDLINWCEVNIPTFNSNLIFYKPNDNRRTLKFKFQYQQLLYIIKTKQFSRIMKFIIWKLFGVCI